MTTRRTVLASAAALMTPAVASGAITAPAPDAELIRLGQDFAFAHAALRQANGVWRAAEREFMAAFALKSPRAADDKCLAEFWRAHEASPAGPASAENERRLDVCDAIAAQIRAIRPTTLAGLSAHAKVARFDGFSPRLLEKDRADLDHDKQSVLDFLDLVEGLT